MGLCCGFTLDRKESSNGLTKAGCIVVEELVVVVVVDGTVVVVIEVVVVVMLGVLVVVFVVDATSLFLDTWTPCSNGGDLRVRDT